MIRTASLFWFLDKLNLVLDSGHKTAINEKVAALLDAIPFHAFLQL